LAVQYAVRRLGLPGRASIERWASAAAGRRAAVTVRFVGAAEGRALNRAYRGEDHATNVLTFPFSEAGAAIAGDVVLCAPVVAREARRQGKPVRAHYAHLLVHGLLHLRGYDHARGRDAAAMEAREVAILRRLGFDDPYATRRVAGRGKREK